MFLLRTSIPLISFAFLMLLSRALSFSSLISGGGTYGTSALSRRAHIFSDCTTEEHQVIQALFRRRVLPMVERAEDSFLPTGNDDLDTYNHLKWVQYFGPRPEFRDLRQRRLVYTRFGEVRDEIERSPDSGVIGIRCAGENVEPYCENGRARSLTLYAHQDLNEVILVCLDAPVPQFHQH